MQVMEESNASIRGVMQVMKGVMQVTKGVMQIITPSNERACASWRVKEVTKVITPSNASDKGE